MRTAGTLGAGEGPLETALQLVDGGRERGSGRSREKERDREKGGVGETNLLFIQRGDVFICTGKSDLVRFQRIFECVFFKY